MPHSSKSVEILTTKYYASLTSASLEHQARRVQESKTQYEKEVKEYNELLKEQVGHINKLQELAPEGGPWKNQFLPKGTFHHRV